MTPEESEQIYAKRRASRKARLGASPLNELQKSRYQSEKEMRRERYEEAKQKRRYDFSIEAPYGDEEEIDDESAMETAPSPVGAQLPHIPPPDWSSPDSVAAPAMSFGYIEGAPPQPPTAQPAPESAPAIQAPGGSTGPQTRTWEAPATIERVGGGEATGPSERPETPIEQQIDLSQPEEPTVHPEVASAFPEGVAAELGEGLPKQEPPEESALHPEVVAAFPEGMGAELGAGVPKQEPPEEPGLHSEVVAAFPGGVGPELGADVPTSPFGGAFEEGRPLQQTPGGVPFQEYTPDESPFGGAFEDYLPDESFRGEESSGEGQDEDLTNIRETCDQNHELLSQLITAVDDLAEQVQQSGGVGP